jgi:hypothetical protein
LPERINPDRDIPTADGTTAALAGFCGAPCGSHMDTAAIIEPAKKVPLNGTMVDVGSPLDMKTSPWCIPSSTERIVCIDPWGRQAVTRHTPQELCR